ncbi:MAG: hypothetical protein M3457_01660 [Chloroflexota bacterium]|nr:hypothetical protein [Chloroflexota bacterium]
MAGSRPEGSSSPLVSGIANAERLIGDLAVNADNLINRVAPPEDRDLIRRAMDLSGRKKLLLARRLWKDPRVQRTARIPMLGGAVYLISPIKLLPARFGPLRQFEKIVGLGLVLWLIVRITPEDVLREHLDAVDRPGPLRRIFKRE